MVKITIENLGKKELLVSDLSLPVLRHIHNHFIDWMHECGGKGRCTTCRMAVISGMENITAMTPAELKYRSLGELGLNERLTCQVRVKGDIVIRVPDACKLPHLHYTS